MSVGNFVHILVPDRVIGMGTRLTRGKRSSFVVFDLIQNARKISCQTVDFMLSLYGCGMIAMKEKIAGETKTERHKFLQRTFRSECQV